MLLNLFISLFFQSTNIQSQDCFNNSRVEIIKIKPKSKTQYYFIDLIKCNNKSNLDSMISNSVHYFNFNAQNDIYILSNNDTIKPISYIFENNIENIRPYYRIIVGFEKKQIQLLNKYKITFRNQSFNKSKQFK